MTPRVPACPRECGASLLDALVTIFIMAFGLLGLAGLHTKMQAAEVESYGRSQALVLLDDMANRIQANRSMAAQYVTIDPLGTGDTQARDCSTLPVGPLRDTCEWSNVLKGAAELAGDQSPIGTMVGARGCVESLAGVSPPSYRVTVTWQGLTPTVQSGNGCAQGLYGTNDALRRVVSRVVAIGTNPP